MKIIRIDHKKGIKVFELPEYTRLDFDSAFLYSHLY
jgi:hypothetical protein